MRPISYCLNNRMNMKIKSWIFFFLNLFPKCIHFNSQKFMSNKFSLNSAQISLDSYIYFHFSSAHPLLRERERERERIGKLPMKQKKNKERAQNVDKWSTTASKPYQKSQAMERISNASGQLETMSNSYLITPQAKAIQSERSVMLCIYCARRGIRNRRRKSTYMSVAKICWIN